MNNIARLTLAAAFFACLAARLIAPASAAEYFVSLQGDDAADGLGRASAFATVQRGVDALQPGDTLTIAPGEYRESVRRDKLGGPDADTVIRAEIPGTAVLRGDRPLPEFRPAAGRRFVYETDFDGAATVRAVNEPAALAVLGLRPNIPLLEFAPGGFYQDRAAGKLYISSPDLASAAGRRFTAALTGTHGLYLADPIRVVIEGLAVTGFHAAEPVDPREGTAGNAWGIFLFNARACAIRDCRAWLNGRGIGVNTGRQAAGNNVIERCAAWANIAEYGSGADSGGLSVYSARRDIIRDSTAFLNGEYGINIYGGATARPGIDEENRSFLRDNLAWGNGVADIKIKTGHPHVHRIERFAGGRPGSASNISASLFQTVNFDLDSGSIALDREPGLDPRSEFADPDNHDYRLLPGSRFRGAGPDGADRGPFLYQANIFYVSPDGDDDAVGQSPATAWRTVARALPVLRAGDTLYLAPDAYAGGLAWRAPEATREPVAIRARGRAPAVIEGAFLVAGGAGLSFERLDFSGPVRLDGAREAAFHNCVFHGPAGGLQAIGADGLRVTQSVFARTQLRLENTRAEFLAGNRYDPPAAAALVLDGTSRVRYADYNRYPGPDTGWSVAGRARPLAELRPAYEQYALAAPAGADLAGLSFQGASFGRHFFEAPAAGELRLAGPFVHSAGATSANLEWWASGPSDCRLAWGEAGAGLGPEITVWSHRAGNFSLTGLRPDTEYVFRLVLDRPLRPLANDGRAAGPEPGSVAVRFRTAAADAPPRTLFVAPDGDDAADGLDQATAWRTIARAAELVRPGDTVMVAGGRYIESVRLRVTGESDRPITFRAAPGEKVVLDGDNRTLQFAFLATDKHHLRFDGFYFTGFALSSPYLPWSDKMRGNNGAFTLYRGRDIRVTRCFSDGRGAGYAPGLLIAKHCADLEIVNCVTVASMGGGISLIGCPGTRVEHNVFLRNLILNLGVVNAPHQPIRLARNIFTDNLASKVHAPIVTVGKLESLVERENCYYLRVPDAEKQLFQFYEPEPAYGTEARLNLLPTEFAEPPLITERARLSLAEFQRRFHPQSGSLVADPGFRATTGLEKADRAGRPVYFFDRLAGMPDLDFPDLFATSPELVERGIGLQPEAFADFHFNR